MLRFVASFAVRVTMLVQNETVLLSVFIACVTVRKSELTSAINVAAVFAASASQDV